MDGHGRLRMRKPGSVPASSPLSSTTAASMPGSGLPADPGLAGWTPGSAAIMTARVSVGHQVSTTGHRSPPMTFQYQSQALGLIGSPTGPSRRSEERSCFSGYSAPHFMHERIAVGAV